MFLITVEIVVKDQVQDLVSFPHGHDISITRKFDEIGQTNTGYLLVVAFPVRICLSRE